jgi:23S rRNA pseudouridine2604 synthase
MLGVTTKKCKVVQEAPTVFRITLIQGLNRQIRRMCEHFGYEVTKLERVRIMHISLKGIPLGEWRDLTKSELDQIFALLKDSSSEVKPKPNPSKPKSNAPKAKGKTSFGSGKPKFKAAPKKFKKRR